ACSRSSRAVGSVVVPTNEMKGGGMRGLCKGVVLGAVTSTLVLTAAAALAGTGIGGIFNLGQTNTVDETTTLTGAKANRAELVVQNTSTSGAVTGLSITTPGSKPAITVSSRVMNPNLNAQFL